MKFYNTLTKKIEPFYTNEPNKVKMYSCGPTVYGYPHIGNMRAYVFTDLLKRVLLSEGYEVVNVINLTDVGHLTDDGDEGQDKMELIAKKQNKDVFAVSKYYSDFFFKYLNTLNIKSATYYPKASDYIEQQISLGKSLEDKGYTYLLPTGLYFDTSKFVTYTELAGLDIDGMTGESQENIGKKNKTDFALWKLSMPDENRQMEWESPWGIGYPGWHSECSAMILELLGEQIDIHTGGIDHIPVHHTNEIAQTESHTGKKFSNFWMHVNFLRPTSETGEPLKMSKSLGNVYTLDDVVAKGYDPMVLKWYYLSSHYRSELKFNWSILDGFTQSYENLRSKAVRLRKQNINPKLNSTKVQYIREAVTNDLNTPLAIGRLWEVLGSDIIDNEKLSIIEYIDEIFGLQLFKEKEVVIPDFIVELAEKRWLAKLNKDFKLSDEIRNEIRELGYIVEDLKSEYLVKKA